MGNIAIHQTDDGAELRRFSNEDPASPTTGGGTARIVCNAAFLPDGRVLATVDRGSFLRFWNSETGELLRSVPLQAPQVGRALAVSPDGKLVACSTDWANDPPNLFVWNIERGAWAHRQTTDKATASLAFSRDGRRLLGAHFGGLVWLWNVAREGELMAARRFGPVGKRTSCAVFSADEKSIFATAEIGEGQLSQWDAETGEEMWRSPHLESGLEGVAVLGPERIVTIGADKRVRLWQHHAVVPPP